MWTAALQYLSEHSSTFPVNPSAATVSFTASALAGSETIPAIALCGFAQAGTKNSVTLPPNASRRRGAYVGDRINISWGTGWGQTGIITSYNPNTQVAQVANVIGGTLGWTTNQMVPSTVWAAKPLSQEPPVPPDTTSYCAVLNTTAFEFLGCNPQWLAPRSHANPGNSVLVDLHGTMEPYSQFETSFSTAAKSLDLHLIGGTQSAAVWVDGQQ
jgi:hypothetical protein